MGATLFLIANPTQAEDYNPLKNIPPQILENPVVISVCPDVDNPSYDYVIACDGIKCAKSGTSGFEMIVRSLKGKAFPHYKETTCNRGVYLEPNPKYLM